MGVRVVLADDHAMLREGLKALLEKNGVSVVGEAENGSQAVEMALAVRPQVVVMDLSMPVMNGIEAAAEIRQESGIPSILLTMHAEEQHVLRAFKSGRKRIFKPGDLSHGYSRDAKQRSARRRGADSSGASGASTDCGR
jgi:DNA-binding NarL/FixJ family response regulator